MGCRTRANEYYANITQRQVQQNRWQEQAVEGNVVRKAAPVQAPEARIKRRTKKKTPLSLVRALRKQKAILAAAGLFGAAVIVGLCALTLMVSDRYSALHDEINAAEKTLEEMTAYNDAREYDIFSSVDLDYVITVATEQLGMVRGSASQVIRYSVKDSEYLQQVAKVPTE